MPSCQLVPNTDGPLLRHPDLYPLIDSGGQVITGKDFHIDHFTPLAVRYPQRGVFYLAGFLTEYGAQELLLGGKLCFSLGRNLAHQNIIRANPGPDSNDAIFVKFPQAFLTHIRDVTGDFLWAKFSIAGFYLILFNVD